ncbi:MAG: pyridoxamine 5'-phosphate oxidase [Candidatus Tokpelaia sp. JSC189]|nr:MAG: pyridoxamine 5'-phosphate oxidase [Candidatus Tokpelaia sp. JSC189]
MADSVLTSHDFVKEKEPFQLFDRWFKDAETQEINDPNAMSLATVDETGMPNVRMVLLKGFSQNGFIFYTNYESRKGKEILHSMKAALCFHWKSLRRQIRVRGLVEKVRDEDADAYYASRSRGSQIAAWASRQSRLLDSRFALEKAVAEYTVRSAIGTISRPPYWSGFCIRPLSVEFWRERPFRLHDRVVFTRSDFDSQNWEIGKLYP